MEEDINNKTMEDIKVSLENKFIKLFNQDNHEKCTVHFDYERYQPKPDNSNMVTLTVKTYNPKKEATFRLMRIDAKEDKDFFTVLSAAYAELEKMYNRIGYHSYTLEWGKRGSKVQKSYFHGTNPIEVLEKFYEEFPDAAFYGLIVNPIS